MRMFAENEACRDGKPYTVMTEAGWLQQRQSTLSASIVKSKARNLDLGGKEWDRAWTFVVFGFQCC